MLSFSFLGCSSCCKNPYRDVFRWAFVVYRQHSVADLQPRLERPDGGAVQRAPQTVAESKHTPPLDSEHPLTERGTHVVHCLLKIGGPFSTGVYSCPHHWTRPLDIFFFLHIFCFVLSYVLVNLSFKMLDFNKYHCSILNGCWHDQVTTVRFTKWTVERLLDVSITWLY